MKTWHVLLLAVAYMFCNIGPNIWAELHKYDIALQCIAGVEYSHLANGNLMMNLDLNGRPVACQAQQVSVRPETRL